MKINIANVLVDDITTAETLDRIDEYVRSGKPHHIVTTYSEFVVFTNSNSDFLKVLNQADLSLPDGVGILWAAKYLSLQANNALDAIFQLIYTGASLVFNPEYVRHPIREKVSGSKLIWDIAKLAAEKNYSLALVGGVDSVAAQSAAELKKLYPNLKVNLALSGRPFDTQTVQEIANSNSDILCIAYAPPKQEKWLAENLAQLNVKVAIGLGGTFDYLSGKHSSAPQWMINLGLEWLYRLVTQPWRLPRMWNAIAVFITIIYQEKIRQIHARS